MYYLVYYFFGESPRQGLSLYICPGTKKDSARVQFAVVAADDEEYETISSRPA